MPKTLLINGTNVTAYLPPTGYTVGYQSVDGGQGGTMQDGTYTEDEIAIKAVISIPCMPLSDAQIALLLSNVFGNPYCAVQYYDPMRGTNRQINARRSVSTQKYRGAGANGSDYWTGTIINLIER